ncbi:MAG: hypothetical protein JW712_13100 [Dehalococcoidales bacterium]|nr:hypothetical protein [Dehalococcoidales bacterium]
MTNWQITAKTIYCDSLQDEVTIIIKKDWSVQCTGYIEFTNSGTQSRKNITCEGPECSRVLQYKQQLEQEETIQ